MNENLQRLLPNPFATDYTGLWGKIEESMIDLYTEKELKQFARSIFEYCLDNLYFNGYDDASGQLYKVQKELGLTDET